VGPGTLYNEGIGYADQRLKPDPSTAAIVPWANHTGRMICDTYWDDGRPLGAAPRHVFRRVLERCRELGYEPLIGIEPEFYLLDGETKQPLFEGYHIFNTVRNTWVPAIERIVDEARAFGIDIVTANCEYARSTYALLAPTLNCLKRRRTHTFSPTNVSWGLEDRTALVRIKGGSPKSTHVENRAPTGLSNPYLVSAALLGAGVLGVTEELELEPPAARPAEEDVSKPKLPTTVQESLAALEDDTKLVELLGGEFVSAYT